MSSHLSGANLSGLSYGPRKPSQQPRWNLFKRKQFKEVTDGQGSATQGAIPSLDTSGQESGDLQRPLSKSKDFDLLGIHRTYSVMKDDRGGIAKGIRGTMDSPRSKSAWLDHAWSRKRLDHLKGNRTQQGAPLRMGSGEHVRQGIHRAFTSGGG